MTPLLEQRLTGAGRFVARLVEALARERPIRLTTTLPVEVAQAGRLSLALRAGQEIRLAPDDPGPDIDDDLDGWVRALLARRSQPLDRAAVGRSTGLYTWLRPTRRTFQRELCLLYDFTPLLLPWTHRPETRAEFGQFFANTCALCDHAIAISASTRADARWLTPLDPERVEVGYPGPSLCARRHASNRAVARHPNLLLVVSTLEPRKNARFLTDWFLETRVVPPDAELWWVGPLGWLESVPDQPMTGPRGQRLRYLGTVADGRLCELYRQAACTIYPSLYEGFGLPVLDSLLHGTPVLCSFNSSLEELAGPGVGYFDPYDPATLDAAFERFRAEGKTALGGPELRERFSWSALARQVIGLAG